MLSEAARALWAKSPKLETDPKEGHAVIAHLLDVAACAWEILQREPPSTLELLAQDFQLEVAQARAWVCALVGLHDLGKASPAFQQKWKEGCENTKRFLPWHGSQAKPPCDIPHSAISQVALQALLQERGWSFLTAKLCADAVGAHHGWRVEKSLLQVAKGIPDKGDAAWDGVRKELFDCVLGVFGATETPATTALSAAGFQRLAGLTSFADWVGSSFPFASFRDPVSYLKNAKLRAKEKLDSVGWTKREPLLAAPRTLEDVFSFLDNGRPFVPRALQRHMAALLEDITAPALFVVEAPMGEGKTEAAFYGHLGLQRRLGHRGLYVALPTQATGNAMFERTKTFLASFGEGRENRLDLQLLHGATLLLDRYQSIVIHDIDEKPEESVVARSYFSNRKRALLSEYGVGTVDQALLGALNIKHQFVRLWGLGNRVVVLDEVHAYDTYTGTLIENLVKWLHALGSSVIVMSATLPAQKRKALLETFGATGFESVPYPRLTRVMNGKSQVVHFPASTQKHVTLEPLGQDTALLAETLLHLTKDQGCAVCIVNTVDRAQQLYGLLKDNLHGIEVLLFHARFPVTARQAREQVCLKAFGKSETGGRNPNRPQRAVLIATQVVEQSLDLDFDVMVSDLAPIDLLLQRAGRLHRHAVNDGQRGTHTKPVLYVAGFNRKEQPDLNRDHWNLIYDEYILLRSWRVMTSIHTLEFPKDIDDLVQTVYGEDAFDGFEETMQQHLEKKRLEREHKTGVDAIDAHLVTIGDPTDTSWEDPTREHKAHPEDEPETGADTRRISTRKGEANVTVVPVYKTGAGHALEPNGKAISIKPELGLEESKRIYAQSLRLGRKAVVYGLEAHLKTHFPHGAPWQKTALLKGVFPMVLEDGVAKFGETGVRFDADLGVVYERRHREL